MNCLQQSALFLFRISSTCVSYNPLSNRLLSTYTLPFFQIIEWGHPWLLKDINSRFVSRSPIHNILNNLAASFQLSIMRTNEEMDGQSRKRQKTDVYPAYLLNFCCPRSSYDLHFEPSKTIVEFKVIQRAFNFCFPSFYFLIKLHFN
jgi:hypothetical protein